MPEYMRDNGGKTSTLRESLKLLITRLKTHMPHEEENTENFCGATVHTETELRELPKKKKKNFVIYQTLCSCCCVCVHGCNHAVKALHSLVLSPNHKSGFQF